MKGVKPLEIAKKHELTKGIDIIQSRLVIGHEILTTGIHGVGAGAVVGTTLAQTLTNKTLTSPTVNTPTIIETINIIFPFFDQILRVAINILYHLIYQYITLKKYVEDFIRTYF